MMSNGLERADLLKRMHLGELFVSMRIGVDENDISRCAPNNGCPLLINVDPAVGRLSCPFEPEHDSPIYSTWEDGERSPACIEHADMFRRGLLNENLMSFIIASLSERMIRAIRVLIDSELDERGELVEEIYSFSVTHTLSSLQARGIIDEKNELTPFGTEIAARLILAGRMVISVGRGMRDE